MKSPRTVFLKTPFEEYLYENSIPFSEYPRPQFKRDSYICLNGKWSLSIKNQTLEKWRGDIIVPFPPESRISSVCRTIKSDDTLIYTREFAIPNDFIQNKVFLHFGACDQYTTVSINGNTVGKNVGGYLPFSFDITEFVRVGVNNITVEATDPLDKDIPYGKQTFARGGMWYTNISGIWQTVWIESVPKDNIKTIKITPSLDGVHIGVDGGTNDKTLILKSENNDIFYNFSGNEFDLKIESPVYWTPENPHLYYFTLISGDDKIESYFALRTIDIADVGGKQYIRLNGKPYFFHGLLDQGYFSDGIYTPATPEGFKNDILQMKSCGFNTLRKHIKLEPDLFYYYCDKYGMVVFQDMINNGKYNFFIDTALPTVTIKSGIRHKADNHRKEEFYRTAYGIADLLYNHPSVCYYTIFNEGWGQFDADGCYSNLKAYDKTRIWDATSGWFRGKYSDVDSEHIYFKPVKLKSKHRPLVLSEFGGYSCKIKEHSFNHDKTFGYPFFKNTDDFENALISMYEKEIIPCIKNGLCAAVLTQVSDVEDETNGLLTYDRKVLKVNAERMSQLADRLKKAFYEQ